MVYNQYQNPYPNYNPYYNPYVGPQQRLQALEQQYPQYGQTMPPMPQQPAQAQQAASAAQSQSPIMSVTSEQQARDYPLDLSGAPMIFVMNDDSKIFAKRFNVSNGLSEFETYEKISKNTPVTASAPQDNALLLGVVSGFADKLNAIQGEIQAIREDIKNGNQFGGDSKPAGKQKSANATNNATDSGDGASGK